MVEDLNVKPEKYYLGEIAPNPLSTFTQFELGIIYNAFVSLNVFDTKGVRVATILSKEMQPGVYKVTWSPEKLSSGIYFLQLIAGNITETRKIVIIK